LIVHIDIFDWDLDVGLPRPSGVET